jgi:hypothetical protein
LVAEALDGLPEDLEECERKADEADAATERIAVGDRGMLQRYQSLLRNIEAQEGVARTQDAAIEKLQARYPHLINGNFAFKLCPLLDERNLFCNRV